MAELKAAKKLTFKREGGDLVIKAGETFVPDKSMDVDKMLKSGKAVEVGAAKRRAKSDG